MSEMHNIDFTLGALIKMKNLLSDPKRWHRGDLRGEGPDGKTSYCTMGAFYHVVSGGDHVTRLTNSGLNCRDWLFGLIPDGNYELFNDFATGHSTIMQFLDCAIDQRLREIDYCVEIKHDEITGQVVFPWMQSISSKRLDLSEESLEEVLVHYKTAVAV